MPAGPDDARPPAHAAQGASGMKAQFPTVFDQQVGDLMFLQVRPEILDGVEFGRIRREFFQPEPTSALAQHGLDRPATVDGGPVSDDQQLARQVPEQRL